MIGIFGGSGFYKLLSEAEKVEIDTPFGAPSSPVMVGKIGTKEVAFIARHGLKHEFPPHRIPYKANRVGDILTVLIYEYSNATSQAETKTQKTGKFSTSGGPDGVSVRWGIPFQALR